jgi:hypothetical protein
MGRVAGRRDWPLRSGTRPTGSRLGRDEHRGPRGPEGALPRSLLVRAERGTTRSTSHQSISNPGSSLNACDLASHVAKEIVGDKITLEVTEVIDHYGETIVRGRYDGEYDKTNLPDEQILTNYFTVRDGKIVSLIMIRNTPAY